MSRTLGSFNQQVNLPSHPEDTQLVRPPRMAALQTETLPDEPVGATGANKFVFGRGERKTRGPENRRYAGTDMNIDLRVPNTIPYEDTEAFNYGQNSVKFSHGMQTLFAPPLAGAAESRVSTASAPMSSYYS